MIHILHKWSKWEPFTKNFIIYGVWGAMAGKKQGETSERWQRRTCTDCGYEQIKKIGG